MLHHPDAISSLSNKALTASSAGNIGDRQLSSECSPRYCPQLHRGTSPKAIASSPGAACIQQLVCVPVQRPSLTWGPLCQTTPDPPTGWLSILASSVTYVDSMVQERRLLNRIVELNHPLGVLQMADGAWTAPDKYWNGNVKTSTTKKLKR